MNSMMDIITSFIIAGMLGLIVIQTDANVKSSSIALQRDIRTQDQMKMVSDMISWEFRKIGHCLQDKYMNPKDPTNFKAITLADSSHIKFSYFDNPRAVPGVSAFVSDSIAVEYLLSSDDTDTPNPYDKKLVRRVNGQYHAGYSLGLTRFRLQYYNKQGTELTTPVVSDSLPRIRSIRITYQIESREPFKNEYSKFMYVTRITPKNLLGI